MTSPDAGVALLKAGRFADALAPLRAALEAGSAPPAMVLNLAIAEDRAGDRRRARRLMQSVAVRLPDWDEPLLRLAESLRAAGENADAEDAYQQVLALNPARSEAMVALGGLLLLRGEAVQARDLLRRCCARVPGQCRGVEHAGPRIGRVRRPAGCIGCVPPCRCAPA